jgi:hypothetical protein
MPRRRTDRTTEMDLWNLDDDLPADALAQEILPEVAPAEKIVRIQKGTINLDKKAKKNHSKPELRVSPKPVNTKSSHAPQEVKPQELAIPQIKKSHTKGVGPMEDAIWADFDFDEPHPSAPPAKPQEEPAAVLKPDTYRTEPLAEPEMAPEPTSQPVLGIAAPVSTEEIPAAESPPQAEETSTTPQPTPLSFEETTSSDAPQTGKRLTRVEMIACAVFVGLLIAAAAFGIHLFRSNVIAEDNPFATPDFPVKGAIAQVKDAATYWRAPILEGSNADTIKRDIILLPVIDITLDENQSGNGALRVIFYNEKGAIAGDIITREFRKHRFEQNGSSTLSIASTAGFTDFGEVGAYRASLNDPWIIKVYEGPNVNAPSSSFVLLFSTAISTEKR